MSYVPATADPDLWATLGVLVAGSLVIQWRARRRNDPPAGMVTNDSEACSVADPAREEAVPRMDLSGDPGRADLAPRSQDHPDSTGRDDL